MQGGTAAVRVKTLVEPPPAPPLSQPPTSADPDTAEGAPSGATIEGTAEGAALAPSEAGTDIADSVSVAETAEEFTADGGGRRRAEIPRAETRREGRGGPFTVYLVTLRGGGKDSIIGLPKVCFRRAQTLPQGGRA